MDGTGADNEIHSTTAGAAAWRAAGMAEHPFDVAIVDVKGLGCEGIKLARKLRAGDDGPAAEIILLIGLDGAIADASLDSVGAFAMLTKPPRPSVLFDCLASIASGARENGVASFYIRKCDKPARVASASATSRRALHSRVACWSSKTTP